VEEETTARWETLCAAWSDIHPELRQKERPQCEGPELEAMLVGCQRATSMVYATPGRPIATDGAEDCDATEADAGAGVGHKRPLATAQLVGSVEAAVTKKPRTSESGCASTPAGANTMPAIATLAPHALQPSLQLPIAETFQSSVCVDMRCLRCGYQYPTKHEPYQHLSLDLAHPSGNNASSAFARWNTADGSDLHVGSLLRGFFGEETRELNCEHCANGSVTAATTALTHARSPDTVSFPLSAVKSAAADVGKAVARTSLAVAPRVLVLQLKRFRYDATRQDMVKVHTEVMFPPTLDVSEYMADGRDNEKSVDAGGELKTRKAANTKPGATPSADGGVKQAVWESTANKILQGDCDPTLLLQYLNNSSVDSTRAASAVPSTKYELTAVVRHLGVTERSGHYICDIRASAVDGATPATDGAFGTEGQWRRCDDSNVYPIDQVRVCPLLLRENPPSRYFYEHVCATYGMNVWVLLDLVATSSVLTLYCTLWCRRRCLLSGKTHICCSTLQLRDRGGLLAKFVGGGGSLLGSSVVLTR
jgi:hypothetical protein